MPADFLNPHFNADNQEANEAAVDETQEAEEASADAANAENGAVAPADPTAAE